MVTVSGLSKSFGGSKALDDVSLDFLPGEVHALVGENGAGKSTLIRILGGYHVPDSGIVQVSGATLPSGSVSASQAAGISVVHQESTAFVDLNVEDNLFVGREHRKWGGLFLDKTAARAEAQELLARIGAVVPLGTPLSEVSLAQRQLVAIAGALSFKSKLLVLDEPTASLSHREADRLHEIVKTLKAQGVCVVYVSHRLDEIVDLADRATILRDGKKVGTLEKSEITRERLIKDMVGRDLGDLTRVPTAPKTSPVVVKVESLSRKNNFTDVSFEVREGEILGLGGLVGAGRTEVARSLFGIDRPDSGRVTLDGKPLSVGSVQGMVQKGMALVPEDRQHQGLVLQQSVAKNIVMSVRSALAKLGLIDNQSESQIVTGQVANLAIKTASTTVPVSSLSGGNQQKVVFAKWLATKPRFLILDEPTRGVDVGSKAEIHARVRELAASGTAVLVISSDLPELLALSDRIVVMREGAVVGELSQHEATEESVLSLAFESRKEGSS